jgi:hypothetical protein
MSILYPENVLNLCFSFNSVLIKPRFSMIYCNNFCKCNNVPPVQQHLQTRIVCPLFLLFIYSFFYLPNCSGLYFQYTLNKSGEKWISLSYYSSKGSDLSFFLIQYVCLLYRNFTMSRYVFSMPNWFRAF